MHTKKILVTGAAGFIGYHLCESLIRLGYNVIGLDNINSYYDINLKYSRLCELGIKKENAEKYDNISESNIHGKSMQFIRLNIEDRYKLPLLFKRIKFDLVCNLAAQPGVRFSLQNPEVYIDSNINGFLNILECCRHYNVERLVYASSSSVYGNNVNIPFDEKANVDRPISLYAASKKSNELMAFTYSHLFGFETIGLRFFTVYGPWGRPDMAMFLFTKAIIEKEPINVYNEGDLARDFTYIDDIIGGLISTLLKRGKNKKLYKIYNIGSGKPIRLLDFIENLEKVIGITATKNMLPMQDGDVNITYADTTSLELDYNYKPRYSFKKGIENFVSWYKKFYAK